jgi:glucose dehydrogenase
MARRRARGDRRATCAGKWSAELPANGKQFVVVAAGGHSTLRSKMGDDVVAFSLP